jgi:3-methyl-2-oxobutanoate hydroxymethyltransferase
MTDRGAVGARPAPRPKITAPHIVEMKRRSELVVAVTAYDHPTARLADEAGVDILLVGDRVGTVVLGYENTLPVTVEEILHHTRAVARAKPSALLVADMPFLSYQVSDDQAVMNAGRMVKEGGADAVKLEGGERVAEAVRRIVGMGVPVMGHLGLTPQSVLAFGGYKVQARGEAIRSSCCARRRRSKPADVSRWCSRAFRRGSARR